MTEQVAIDIDELRQELVKLKLEVSRKSSSIIY